MARYSRATYRMVAEELGKAKGRGEEADKVIEHLAIRFAILFSLDNERFDAARFHDYITETDPDRFLRSYS